MAQLVVHFMKDPVAGLVEMARVTRPGGSRVGLCLGLRRWPVATRDILAGRDDLDPDARTEDDLAGARMAS